MRCKECFGMLLLRRVISALLISPKWKSFSRKIKSTQLNFDTPALFLPPEFDLISWMLSHADSFILRHLILLRPACVNHYTLRDVDFALFAKNYGITIRNQEGRKYRTRTWPGFINLQEHNLTAHNVNNYISRDVDFALFAKNYVTKIYSQEGRKYWTRPVVHPSCIHTFMQRCKIASMYALMRAILTHSTHNNLCILRCLQKVQEIKALVKQSRALQK